MSEKNIYRKKMSASRFRRINLFVGMIELIVVIGVATCPEKCSSCDAVMKCYGVTFVPPGKNTRLLYLYDSHLESITNKTFANHTDIIRIYLKNVSVSVLQPNSFARLRYLISLTITESQMTELPTGAFQAAEMLRYLSLSNNCIHSIQDAAFEGAINL